MFQKNFNKNSERPESILKVVIPRKTRLLLFMYLVGCILLMHLVDVFRGCYFAPVGIARVR